LGVTPEFLGYVTDGSQTIGFITEFIDSGELEEEHGGRAKEGCLSALQKVHERGIAHGDAHDGNCMLRVDRTAVLIDWELYVETCDRSEFERDLDIMGRCLWVADLDGA
jgi:RIO-like serine/threonine protein kinase